MKQDQKLKATSGLVSAPCSLQGNVGQMRLFVAVLIILVGLALFNTLYNTVVMPVRTKNTGGDQTHDVLLTQVVTDNSNYQMKKKNNNNDSSNIRLVKLPYPLIIMPSEYLAIKNYFHSLVFITFGLVELSKIGYDLSTAKQWRKIRLIYTGLDIHDTNISRFHTAGQRLFTFLDGRFLPNGQLDPNPIISNKYNKSFQVHSPRWGKRHRRQRPFWEDAVPWIHTFIESKFGIKRVMYPKQHKLLSQSSREDFCNEHIRLNWTSVLIASRISGERQLNLSGLANDLNRSGLFDKVTYIEDLGIFPVKEQARLFATHMFSVQPHGAGEANLLFATPPNQQNGPPHIAIEIVNPYADCIECEDLPSWLNYRRSATHMMIYTISSVSSKMSCQVFCSHIRKSKEEFRTIMRYFRGGIPAQTVNASLITRIISDKLQSVIIPHCNGRIIKAPPEYNDFHAASLEMDEHSEQFQSFIQAFTNVTGKDFRRAIKVPIKPMKKTQKKKEPEKTRDSITFHFQSAFRM